ncbi:MAG: phosphoribosylamine--glycine ligase [Chrysiogenales bacterium]|nr:MAG: phosphoribosylamine--glycine ligase [Chrysiogenales bacterium]
MKYLIIGSGGREHTIAWRLIQDGSADEVYVAPGNGGISPSYRVDIDINDHPGIARFCVEKKIDMVIVGPEAPLVGGIIDFLDEKKIPAFGPTRKAAMLEGSKLFAKEIMDRYGVPTVPHREFRGKDELVDYIRGQKRYPLVIKLDGLAAGKGVGIPESMDEALRFINTSVTADTRVFVEDFVEGEEASVLCVSDGRNIIPFIAAQDHKRIFDGDRGPNTGGMGAYAPAPVMTDDRLSYVHEHILQRTVDGMRSEGIPFKGILYAGVIISGDSIRVLEFNVRFGDPEAQVIIPLMNGRLGDLFSASVNESLGSIDVSFKNMHAITVVVSSGGYPGEYEKGKIISGLDRVESDIIVFNAGTEFLNGNYRTNGGRVLDITALGATLAQAKERVYGSIGSISFEGAHYRTDIGHRAL